MASVIHDPVTTTDELIPSGETSSYRSNPLGLAEFTLSRKDPEYVGRAKAIQAVEKVREAGECMGKAFPEVKEVMHAIKEKFEDVCGSNTGVGSTIYAVKPGDGSAREQAASCQKVSRWMGKHCKGIRYKEIQIKPYQLGYASICHR